MDKETLYIILLAIAAVAVVAVLLLTGTLNGWLSQTSRVAGQSAKGDIESYKGIAASDLNAAACSTFMCSSDVDCRPPSEAGASCGSNGICAETGFCAIAGN